MSNIRHGMCGSPEYAAWCSIKTRCYNKNFKDYHLYGGRGITVCDEWIDNFYRFYADMGDRPSENHSIDRINTNDGYSQGNCRWATSSQQARNRRISSQNTSGIQGVYLKSSLGKWCVHMKFNKKYKHFGVFTDFFEAVCVRKSAENKYWHNNSEVGV